jgi:putative aldouronate transport system substrate-binding protein
MNRLKKITALIVTVMMIAGMLSGCSGSKAKETTSDSASNVTKAAEATGSADDQTAYFKSKKACTLKIMIFGSSTSDACKRISTELSKITEKKLNCDVELTEVGFGSYMEQLNMMLFSGDEFDLFAPMGSATDMVTNDQIQPIGELIDKYGKDIKKIVPERDWAVGTYSDKVYGVPVNSEKAEQLGFGMRKDICDELGIDNKNMSTLDQIHDALVKVKKAYPDMYPVVSDTGQMFAGLAWIGQDSAGDSYNLTVTEDPYASQPKIVSFFDTDLFKDRVKMLYQWAKEGLIMPDASTNTESAIDLVRAGKAFGYFQHMKPGWEQEQSEQIGKEMVSARYSDPIATSDQIAWYVPTSSADPERAVALLNLMYSDPEVSNLVINGIENKDYVIKDKEKGVAGYPEGVDGSSATYYRMGWGWPNQQISYIWDGQDTDIWDQYKDFNNNAKVKVSLGFKFDPSNVMNEITACTNVYQKYVPAFYAGSLDPETTLSKLNKEMKESGIDTIIKEKQTQIDAWLAKQSK